MLLFSVLLVIIASAINGSATPLVTSHSTAPAVSTTVPVGDPDCKDTEDCLSYGHAACSGPYKMWAERHCPAFCGFCMPITSPFLCEDKINNCNQHGGDICTNPAYGPFVEMNCMKFCHMCPDERTTPVPRTGCVDNYERCDEFGKSTCTNYPDWSKIYCRAYCGFCVSNDTSSVQHIPTSTVQTTPTVTPTPTSSADDNDPCHDKIDCSGYNKRTTCCGQYETFSRDNCARHCHFCEPKVKRVCVDTIPNCDQYGSDLCTNESYESFVDEKCSKFCDLCNNPYIPSCAYDGNNKTVTEPRGPVQRTSTINSAPSATTTTIADKDDECVDRRDCSGYDIHIACCGQYEAFSRANCAKHCRFCFPKVTEEPPVCNDTIPNCAQYNSDLCTNLAYQGFVAAKCAGFCQICEKPLFIPPCARNNTTSPAAPTTPTTTTPTPMHHIDNDPCHDKIDCSGYNRRTTCCGTYEAFSRDKCAKHCHFCEPKVKPVCVDTIPNCDQYGSDLCTNEQYASFVEEKCSKFCDICNNPYIPPCAYGGNNKTAVQTTPTTTPTPTIPIDKCVSAGRYYSVGDGYDKVGCTEHCTCVHPVNNTFSCEPISCPKWKHNCDLIHVEGRCCPYLKCNYITIVHETKPSISPVHETKSPTTPIWKDRADKEQSYLEFHGSETIIILLVVTIVLVALVFVVLVGLVFRRRVTEKNECCDNCESTSGGAPKVQNFDTNVCTQPSLNNTVIESKQFLKEIQKL